MGMAAKVAPEKMCPAMATTVGSETSLLATAAPPSGAPWSSSAIRSNLKPLNSPPSSMAIIAPCEISLQKAALSPVIGAPMPILIVCPDSITAHPPASVAQTAGGPAGAAVGAGGAGGPAARKKLNTKSADRIRRAFMGVPPPLVHGESKYVFGRAQIMRVVTASLGQAARPCGLS